MTNTGVPNMAPDESRAPVACTRLLSIDMYTFSLVRSMFSYFT